MENGRRYHKYHEGGMLTLICFLLERHLTPLAYPYPNDEQELDRLDLQHHMSKLIMGGKLYHVPLEDPEQILDIGTGSGIWPIEMGMVVLPHNSMVCVECVDLLLFVFGFCSIIISKSCNHRHRSFPSPTNRGPGKCSLSCRRRNRKRVAVGSESFRLHPHRTHVRRHGVLQGPITPGL